MVADEKVDDQIRCLLDIAHLSAMAGHVEKHGRVVLMLKVLQWVRHNGEGWAPPTKLLDPD
jgi:hypothetical protein